MTAPTKIPAGQQLLHYVVKSTNLRRTLSFYKHVLGMHVLRHEEFNSGCEAQCNGPYARPWSKTMLGYAQEHHAFVIEVTYNYGIKSYQRGDEFGGFKIVGGGKVLEKARQVGWPNIGSILKCPDGYDFNLIDTVDKEPALVGVILNTSNAAEMSAYYAETLGMAFDISNALLFFNEDPKLSVSLEVKDQVNSGESKGRLALAVPTNSLKHLESEHDSNHIHTPHTELPTEGKATVEVVITLDPDMNEVCLVGSEAFMELSEFTGERGLDWNARQDMGSKEVDADDQFVPK